MRKVLLLASCMASFGCNDVVCTATGAGTWWGAPPTSSGIVWTGTGCGATPPADANIVISGLVSVPSNLGSPSARLTGTVSVAPGGVLHVAPGATLSISNDVAFGAGSTGFLNGQSISLPAPDGFGFPSPVTIRLDLSSLGSGNGGFGLPSGWTLCNATSSCGPMSIHPATSNEAATLLYVDWPDAAASGSRAIAADGTPPPTQFPNDPGLFLTVVAVDPPAHAITLALPDVGTTGAAVWYAVPKALAGTQLENLVGGTQWTVSSAGLRSNNEQKQRFEIRFDAADAPFDADHQFEGYLLCRHAGGYCARIIKTLANHHDGTGETAVVWNDPTGAVQPGDEMDVYYAKPAAGDPLVFVNPVKLDLSGGGRLIVVSGANVATASNPASGWWVTGATGNKWNDLRAGVDFENETLGVHLDLALIEHGEGLPMPVANSSADTLGFVSRTAGVGVRDLLLSRTTLRYPQVDQSVWTDGTTGYSAPNAIVPQEPGAGNLVDPWTDDALRKIRIEGFTYGLNGARGGRLRSCKDGLWIQDLLMLHGRSARPVARNTVMDDSIETFAVGADCGIDRLAISVGTWTTGLNIRSAQEAPIYWTSIVAFGASGRISDTFPSVPDSVRYPSFATFYCQPPDGTVPHGAYPCAGYAKMVNWMTDGIFTSMDNYFGARMDYYVADAAVPPSVASCGESVGYYAVGGATNLTAESELGAGSAATAGLCTPASTPRLVDAFLANLQTEINFSAARNAFALVWASQATQPPASYTFDGVFLSNTDATNTGALFDTHFAPAGWTLPNLVMKDVTYAYSAPGGAYLWWDVAGTDGIANVQYTNVVAYEPPPGSIFCVTNGVVGPCLPCPICDPSYTDLTINGPGAGTALPQYAGPIVYDWPFAWATVGRVPGFRRTSPRGEFIPPILQARLSP